MNSGTAAAVLEAMVAFGSYEVGTVQRLPYVRPDETAARAAKRIVESRMREAQRAELDHLFVSPWAGTSADVTELCEWSREIDHLIATSVGHDEPIVPLSATYPTEWFQDDFESVPTPGVEEELSYVVGVALGRWDVRYVVATAEPKPMPGPFEALPAVSRAMLVGPDGIPAPQPPTGYPINFPSDRLLHDDPGHPQDICAAIDRVRELLEESSEIPELVLSAVPDLRKHLRDKFFAAHLKQYSVSRRYAPLYWQLTVPSKRWGLWLYAPALNRESLFAIARAAREKLASLNEQIRLASERPESDRDARERAEGLEELAAEVERFAGVADEVAQSGWEPDLNDGFVLNAAPLEKLFVDKKWLQQIARHRKAMQKGEYPWATVQRDYFEKRT